MATQKEAIEAEGMPDDDKAKSMEQQIREQEELAAERKAAGEDPGEPTPPKEPQTIDELYDRSSMKSGRGFITPDGKFLSTMEAKGWVKENEPDVHEMWLDEEGGDKQASFGTESYGVACGSRIEPQHRHTRPTHIKTVAHNDRKRLAAAREGLNKIKASLNAASKYGKEVLRTLFVGQRDTRITATTQLRDSIEKLIPDYKDQQALTYFRDYKGRPQALQDAIDRYEIGDNEQQKALNESRRIAQNPSEKLLQADKMYTEYMREALDEKRQLQIGDSTIDPANYVPHDLRRVSDESSGSGNRPMTTFSPRSLERKHLTLDDAVDAGSEKLEPRSVNALDLLSRYGEDHATVVATKLLATELTNTELGPYGTPANHPDGWERVPGDVFRKPRPM